MPWSLQKHIKGDSGESESCWKKCSQTCCSCLYERKENEPTIPNEGKNRKSISLAHKTLRTLTEAATKNAIERSRDVEPKFMPLTFVPDFIIKEIFNNSFQKLPSVISSDVVLLIADVCGFTSLCESYCQKGVTGIEELAYVLNGFMSTLSAMLISGGGDILNFAGDAFLVQWVKENEENAMQKAVQKAYQCAVALQTHQCLQTKNLNGTLKVKIGIAMGNTTTWVLGTNDFLLFAAAGRTIPIVNKAEVHCGPGEICVSEDAFNVLKESNTNVFNTKELEDGFVKIFGYESPEDDSEPMPNRIKLFEECEDKDIARANIFLTPSVRGIKSADELEYISELTMVTILFISLMNVDVAEPKVLGETFYIILDSVKKFGGVLNKMLLFDKGCTYLVAFGLPGLKHANDAVRGIYCAEDVVEKLGKMNIQVSVGISTGTCFCGIVGHPQRQEYTAIGSRVNMAARIMVVYNDEAIAVNENTYHLSRDEIGHVNFAELPARKMKGIESAGAIYAYRRQTFKRKQSLPAYDIVEDSDLEGSAKERERIRSCVAAMQDDNERAEMKKNKLLPVLIIKGESSSGKSYLMFLAVDFGVALGYKVVVCCAIQSYADEPFFVISRLIMRMFGITMMETCFERQEILLNVVSKHHYSDLYLLNHLFDVNFPIPDNVSAATAQMNECFISLAKHIMQQFLQNESTLIAVDNADSMDDQSWYLIHELAEEERILVVLSIRLDFKEVNLSASVLLLKAYVHVSLEASEADYFAPLLCWFLGVTAVHTTLFVYLKEVTEGKAQLLKEISLSPAISQCVKIIPFSSLDDTRLQKEFFINTFEALQDDEPLACDLKPEVNLRDVIIPQNINDAVKEAMNNLTIQDRLLLKRAAVLGSDFNLHTLEAISPGMKRDEVFQSINNLLVNNIFTSVCSMEDMPDPAVSTESDVMLENHSICFCFNVYLKYKLKHKQAPKWSIKPYHRLKFRTYHFRSVIIAHMTKEQLYNMHMEIADNLEMNGPECAFCRARRTEDIEIQKSEPVKRLSFSGQKKKCVCLERRPKLYSEIASLYKSIGMLYLPVYYERKAAQAANDINYPVMALNYVHIAQELMPKYELSNEEKNKEEAFFDPLVIEVSLKKTKAESFFILGDTYTTVSCISQGLSMLGMDIICFHGLFSAKEFKKILPRFPLLHAEYITKLIGVLSKAYLKSGIYKLALNIIVIEFIALSLYPIDFLQVLTHMTLLHQCKYRINKRKKPQELESNIFKLCHEKLRKIGVLLDLTEMRAIGSTYILIIETNLVLRNFKRSETIATEGMRILNDTSLMPKLKITLSNVYFHSKEYLKCFVTLTDVNQMEAISHSTYAECICGFIQLFMIFPDVSDLPEIETHINSCNEFASAWNRKRAVIVPKDLAFYISVCLTQWCMYSDQHTNWIRAKSVFTQCYDMSKLFYKTIDRSKNNYWVVSALMNFVNVKLECLKESYEEYAQDMDAIEEEMKIWKEVIKSDYPVFVETYQKLTTEVQKVKKMS